MTNSEKKKKFHNLLENELGIYYDLSCIKSRTLEELNLTKPEINLFLNRLEVIFGVYIEEWEFDLNITFEEFITKITENSNICHRTTTKKIKSVLMTKMK